MSATAPKLRVRLKRFSADVRFRSIEGIDKVWRALGGPVAPMRADALMQQAREATGLDDFGPPEFLEGLRRLAQAVNEHKKTNRTGRMLQREEAVARLCYRLRLVDYMKRFDDIERQEIQRPVYIIAPPRSGTTMLHHVMASDKRFRYPRSWEIHQAPPAEPAFVNDPAYFHSDPRAKRAFKNAQDLTPRRAGFQAIHLSDPDGPEECYPFMQSTFATTRPALNSRVASYQQFLREQGDDFFDAAFAFYVNHLKLLQWWAPQGRWLFKAPGYGNNLGSITRQFPDCRIIQLHRPVEKALPSACSLYRWVRRISEHDFDPHLLGRDVVEQTAFYMERVAGFREQLDPKSFLDIRYEDLMSDPHGQLQRIYDHIDMPRDDTATAAHKNWIANNPPKKRGHHRYDAKTFGLTSDDFARLSRFHEKYL